MRVEIIMPNLGIAIEEALLGQWLKNIGDKVAKDEIIAVGENSKVTIDVTSPIDGYLVKQLYQEGDTVPINNVIAIVSEQLEQIEDSKPDVKPVSPAAAVQPVAEKQALTTAADGRIQASPLARRIAREKGADLGQIVGSGPAGFITKKDILSYLESSLAAGSAGASVKLSEQMSAVNYEDVEILPFTGIRKAIAENMVKSKHTAPHVTTMVEVDMSEVLSLKKKLAAEGTNVSTVTFVIKSSVQGILEFPIVNSSIEGDKIVIKKYVNMGVAVAGKDGLLVPVIKNAQVKAFGTLAQEIKELTERGRESKISPEMMKNGTITLSNAGAYGALIATPIINQPQSVILWMGKITKRPVVVNDEIVIREMMYMTLSYDHRVLDGATAAMFLQKVKKGLENPLTLLIS